MATFLLILSLILFIGLIVIHEFGHFLVARRNGVKVLEFGIFFPPRAWHKKMKSGFDFTINWIPLGGFVRLKGEHDSDKGPGSYGAANLWVKTKIMLAGVVMNLLAAYVLLTILALVGMPKLIDPQFTVSSNAKIVKNTILIAQVEDNSPAKQAGLKTNDRLLEIGPVNKPLQSNLNADNLPNITKSLAGQKVDIVYERNGKILNSTTTLLTNEVVQQSQNTNNPKANLGIDPVPLEITKYTWAAPIVAAGMIKQVTILTFKGLGSVIASLAHGKASQAGSQLSGPVGIVYLLTNLSHLGYQFVLVLIALISLTLALINVLPIPALDGGRLFVTLLSRLFKRPLRQRTEELIHGTGFVCLMLLFVLITINDVKRIH